MDFLFTLPSLISAVLSSSTVLALAALGLLINEKSGILNLGAEGMMLCAAVCGFIVTYHSGSTSLGVLAGMGAGTLLALIFGVLVIWLNSNQTATGLALSIFGIGFSAFAGLHYVGKQITASNAWHIPVLSDIPFIGEALFRQHVLVYLCFVLTCLVAWLFYHTRAGLILRAVGESPTSAYALGYPVRWVRLAAVAVGGGLCGLAGAYLSLVFNPFWVEGMTAGKGWIALALTTFATWRPMRIWLGAALFSAVTMLAFDLQSRGVNVPVQLLNSLPYLATIIALALLSRNPTWIKVNMPASLGKPFYPS